MTAKKDSDPRFENLIRAAEQYLNGKGYSASTEKELREALAVPPQNRPLFKKVLEALLERGIAHKKEQKFFPAHQTDQIAVGTLRLHPRGFGFLECDDSIRFPQDIFIPRHLTNNGVDGDRVEVLVSEEVSSPRGPEGRIMTILERSRTHIAGVVTGFASPFEATAYAPLLGKDRTVLIVLEEDQRLEMGDRVVLHVKEWGTQEEETLTELSHIIGNIRDPSCDVDAAIEEYQIRKDFPSPVLEEVKNFGTTVSSRDLKDREDLRHLDCVTIDPDTAKDFDDAISLTKNEKGEFDLGVHIADVSHYVRPGTELDKEAQQRCNSTYFPTKCVPMLPPELSDNLCSLKPQVNRLTISVLMRFTGQGDLLEYRIARSVIRSRKRFTYREAKEVLDGKQESPHKPMLLQMQEMCEKFKQKRRERGSIEFALPELVVLCNDKGVPQKTDLILYDITHQMVEECMLKTNEMIARHLNDAGKDLSYRIHEEPLQDNLQEFAAIALSFGFNVSDIPTVAELQSLFEQAFQTPHGPHLATNYIRKMRLAVYSPDNIGHYGLSLSHYCHFTSPIRRYIDLVNHRILFGDTHEWEHLEQVSEKCSEQERISARAEGAVITLKKLRLLDKWRNEEPDKTYRAIVTKVKGVGIIFEVIDLLLEGFIPIHQMDHDYFVMANQGNTLRGVHYGYEYSIGSTFEVALKEIDLISLHSDWYILPEKKPRLSPPRGKRPSRESIVSKKGKKKGEHKKKGKRR